MQQLRNDQSASSRVETVLQRRLPRMAARVTVLMLLTMFGLFLFAHGSAGEHTPRNVPAAIKRTVGSQRGAAGAGGDVGATCSPLDVQCNLNQLIQNVANSIFGAMTPILDAVDQNSLNFISQTPAAGTYDHPDVQRLVAWSIGVVDVALSVIILIAGYNIMVSRQIGAVYSDVMEFLPRLILAVVGANFSLLFVQMFIDFVNTLNIEVIHLFGLTILTDILQSFFAHPASTGTLAFLLALLLGVMNFLLIWEMLVRLALLVLLIILAPFALMCFSLQQTQEWGQLWLSTFSTTALVQFFQVVMLALGGILVSYLQRADVLHLDSVLLSLLMSCAVLYQVLQIPGLLRVWALRAVANAGNQTTGAVAGAGQVASGVALRAVQVLLI